MLAMMNMTEDESDKKKQSNCQGNVEKIVYFKVHDLEIGLKPD